MRYFRQLAHSTYYNIIQYIKLTDCGLHVYSPGSCTKRLTYDLNNDLELKVQVQFQSLNLD